MYSGVLVHWDSDRGFGFLRQHRHHGGDFVHASAYRAGGIEPAVGTWYRYALAERQPGKMAAVDITCEPSPAVEEASRVFGS